MKQLQSFLNSTTECAACGKEHRINVRHVLYEADAVSKLAHWLQREGLGKRVAVVADQRTWEICGERAATELRCRGFEVDSTLIPDPAEGQDPICDDETFEWLRPQTEGADILLACGSGVVNDLTKWVSWAQEKPYVVVPTALSMNGYVSANVAPLLKGVKSLIHAREPVAVAAVPAVLKEAPPEMTAAGLGDVIAKTVSTADWAMNAMLFDEYYCEICAGMTNDIESVYMEAPEMIGNGTDEGIQALFQALILTGFSMTMAGTSSPASGGEHLISHSLDMMAMRDGIDHDFHGRQVGVGTLFSAALYEKVCAVDVAEPRLPEDSFDPAFWGRFADTVLEKQQEKRQRERQAVTALTDQPQLWARMRSEFQSRIPSPARLKKILQGAGAAHRLQDIGVDKSRFLDAVTHGHEMRERFTILGLARCLGVLPGAAEAIVDKWLLQ